MDPDVPSLHEQLDRLEQAVPRWLARCLAWLRKPSNSWLRIPVGLLLMVGGVFSFLPILGLWMLPLGAVFIAIDIPFLREPTARLIMWGEKKWLAWRCGKASGRRGGAPQP